MTTNTLSIPATMMPATRQAHPFRVWCRLVCAPSLDLPLLRRRQLFVLRKAVPQLFLLRSFHPILWTQTIMRFLMGKNTSPHSSWASSLETPPWMHITSATSAMLGQNEAVRTNGVCHHLLRSHFAAYTPTFCIT